MNKILFSILIMSCINLTHAVDSYDPGTNTLNIPSVQFGSTIYNDVNITVGNVLSVGSSTSVNQTYDLNKLYFTLIQVSSPLSTNYNLSGVVNSSAFVGYGTATINPMTSNTFEGVSSKSQITASSSTINVSGNAVPSTSSETYYYDTNNNVLGFSDLIYHVTSYSKPLPNKVSNYSSGIWFITNDYADSSKKVSLGKTIATYDVFPSNDVNPFVNLTFTTRDALNNVTTVLIRSFLITNQGLKSLTRNFITNGQNPGNTFIVLN